MARAKATPSQRCVIAMAERLEDGAVMSSSAMGIGKATNET